MDDPIMVAGRLHPDLFSAADTPIMEPFTGRCYRVRVQVLMPQVLEVLVLEESAQAARERAQRFVSMQLKPRADAAQPVPFERLRPDQQCVLRQHRVVQGEGE